MKKRSGRHRLPKPRPKRAAAVDDREGLTLQRLADYLHCHYSTAFKLVHRGDIPSFRLGGHWRVLKSEIDEWIKKGGGRT